MSDQSMDGGKRYSSKIAKRLAEEDRKRVLSKAQKIKANQTETGKPADPVEMDPQKQGMQGSQYN